MVNLSLRPYLITLDRVIVVTRPDDSVQSVLPRSIELVEAEQADMGMAHSLRVGVKAAHEEPWVIVGLADMPWVQATTIETIADTLRNTPGVIVRPIHNERVGNPVGFGRLFFMQLATRWGDIGGKGVIEKYPDRVHDVEVQDPGILRDVDYPMDLPS